MMKEFYSIPFSNSGSPIFKVNEVEKLRAHRVSIWKQEEKVVICQLFPSGTVVLTNIRLLFILPSTAQQSQPIGWVYAILSYILFMLQCTNRKLYFRHWI